MRKIEQMTEIPFVGIDPEIIVMPGTFSQFNQPNAESLQEYLDRIGLSETPFALLVLVDPKKSGEEPPDNFYKTGVVASVEVNMESLSIKLQGLYRARVVEIKKKRGAKYEYPVARFKIVEDVEKDIGEYFSEHREDLIVQLKVLENLIRDFLREAKGVYRFNPIHLNLLADNLREIDLEDKDRIAALIWLVAFQIPDLSSEERQLFIQTTSFVDRINLCILTLGRMARVASLTNSVKPQIKALVRRRSQDRASQLSGSGDNESAAQDDPELAKRWENYQKFKDSISPESQKAIEEDFSHLQSCYPGQSEWNTFINHLDCLLTLYSTEETSQEEDISKVEEVLGRSHYGLEDVKGEIYDDLATKIRNPKGKAPILCFVGPPGVGKTSIGKSIAESLGLKFVRLSLGGVRDEADIRGHRLTYIGAIPGKIIQEINRLGVRNPVFMLDEVDKVTSDFRGDPSSALLEVLDPEQNHSFQDHYVGAPFDLSGVLFLCTANLASGIQRALYDRMKVIEIAGYTEFEKIHIATDFLFPEQAVETGFPDLKRSWQDNDPNKVISKIIKGYTREAGVRELKRQIHQIYSRWGRQIAKSGGTQPDEIIITEELIEKLLGPPKFSTRRVKETMLGEAVGLAWTPVGGDILYIQTVLIPFAGKELSLTGSQGHVMQEACKVATSLIRVFLEESKQTSKLENRTIHIHIPEGAVEKDGPSAGVTTFCSLYSRVFGLKSKPFVAMTGELNLVGMITKVGGIKEKVLAAHRDGVKELILPDSNRQDVKHKVPDEIKRELKFHFVSHIKDVLPIVFPGANLTDNR